MGFFIKHYSHRYLYAPGRFQCGNGCNGDMTISIDMVFCVLKSILIPMGISFIVCDGFATVAWIGMLLKRLFPVNRLAVICNPVIIALLGQLMNLIREGMDSGFESLGWLLMYLVCALKPVKKDERL